MKSRDNVQPGSSVKLIYTGTPSLKNRRSKNSWIPVGSVGIVRAVREDGCILVKFDGHGQSRHVRADQFSVDPDPADVDRVQSLLDDGSILQACTLVANLAECCGESPEIDRLRLRCFARIGQ